MISVDLILIIGFLILTLAIGLYYGRGIKTFQDYAVGSRKMSSVVLTLSLIATIYGGGNLITRLDAAYRTGWYSLLLDLSAPMNLYLSSRFIIVRMKEFMGHLSIAESMGSLYGQGIRIVTALFGIMLSIGFFVIQVKVGFTITTLLFPEIAAFSTHITILVTLLIIIYTSFGGARSVVLTDVYQFLLFSLCFPIIIFTLIYNAKDPIAGWERFQTLPQFNPKTIGQWNQMLQAMLSCFIWRSLQLPLDPARTQRFYMSSSLQQATKVFSRTAVIRTIIPLLFFMVAIALHIGSHAIDVPVNPSRWGTFSSKYSSQNPLYYIIQLSYFPGMRGILVTVIFALLMSTADSYLHAASVLFVNDLWPTLQSAFKQTMQPTFKVVRIVSICIGLLGFWIAYYTTHVTQIFNKLINPYLPIITMPFIMTCLGFRPRTATLLSSISINSIIALYRIYYKGETLSEKEVFISFIFSGLLLVAIHYLLPKRPHTGWVGIRDRSQWDLQNQTTKRWWMARIQQLKQLFHINLFPQKTSAFILLGGYIIISTFVALCLIKKHYFLPYIYGYMAVMVIGTTLMIYPALHSYQKGGRPFLHKIWPWALFLLLFVAPLQWAKLGHYGPMVSALFICSIGVAIILLPVETSCLMLVCALVIHRTIPPYLSFTRLFLFDYIAISLEPVYAVVLIAAVVVGVITYKSLRDKAEAKLKIITLTRAYEQRISLEAIYNQANWSRLNASHGSNLLLKMSNELHDPCHYLYTHGQEKLGKSIGNFLNKLNKFGKLLLWKAQVEHGIELHPNKIAEIEWQAVLLNVYRQMRVLKTSIQLLLYNTTPHKQLRVDPELFECFLILNLWEISKSRQAVDHTVTVTISDTMLQYDYAIEMSTPSTPLHLPALAFLFSTETTVAQAAPLYVIATPKITDTLPEKQLYQIESKQIIEAHGGYVTITETEKVVNCPYILPIEGEKVMRFKNYDPTYLATNKQAETANSLAQEKELAAALTATTSLTQEKIMETIAYIKNAHGLVIRQSGEPYYTHPMAVAKILLEVTTDPITLLAGLLHDVVEDTPITLQQVELMYGVEVAALVEAVTHYNTNGYPWKLDENEKMKWFNQCKDIRVVQIKLGDRLHNVRTLYARKLADQQRIAHETLTFYIPWGAKNKITQKWLAEMEATCQAILTNRG